MKAAAMHQRFVTYLKDFSMHEGERLHGLRAGGALSMALTGASLQEIMLQGFWKKPETALHYVGMLQDLTGENMSSAIASKLGAASWVRAEKKSAQAVPFDFFD
jgi:hypothetical protein